VQMPQQSCQTENCFWAPNERPAEILNKCCHAVLAADSPSEQLANQLATASPSEQLASMTANAFSKAAIHVQTAWLALGNPTQHNTKNSKYLQCWGASQLALV
jgi:hypothetical protein